MSFTSAIGVQMLIWVIFILISRFSLLKDLHNATFLMMTEQLIFSLYGVELHRMHECTVHNNVCQN